MCRLQTRMWSISDCQICSISARNKQWSLVINLHNSVRVNSLTRKNKMLIYLMEDNGWYLYKLTVCMNSWKRTVMTSVIEKSNRFISLLRQPVNCNFSRASHLSHSKHSGGIPSSAAPLSIHPHSEASIFGQNCERAPVQMFCQADTCS